MKFTSHQNNLLNTLGYKFRNDKLFEEALTHSSSAKSGIFNNQRLEFLGDRVLGLVISEKLLSDNKDENEGDIHPKFSALVKKETCAEIASNINLGDSLIMSRSESLSGGRERLSILGDGMEALIGAIYLDGGLENVRQIIHVLWVDAFADVTESSYDPKSELNEWSQAYDVSLPEYKEKSRTGPVHAPSFCIEVSLTNGMSARGIASSKRNAEQLAASELLKLIKAKESTLDTK